MSDIDPRKWAEANVTVLVAKDYEGEFFMYLPSSDIVPLVERAMAAGHDEAERECIRAVCPDYCGTGLQPYYRHNPLLGSWHHPAKLVDHPCDANHIYEMIRKRNERDEGSAS